MDRAMVSRAIVGIFGMQVCACRDASDQEILEVCNKENPSGTSNGWSYVVRSEEESESTFITKDSLPVPCEQYPERLHFLVLC